MDDRAENSPTAQNNNQLNQSFDEIKSYMSLDSVTSQQSSNQAIYLKNPPPSCQAAFRDFLENQVKFREAVRITDPLVCNAIHLSYRLQYLKDTAMARFIDDPTSHQITQLIAQYQNQILEYIFGSEFDRIQEELLTKMQS